MPVNHFDPSWQLDHAFCRWCGRFRHWQGFRNVLMVVVVLTVLRMGLVLVSLVVLVLLIVVLVVVARTVVGSGTLGMSKLLLVRSNVSATSLSWLVLWLRHDLVLLLVVLPLSIVVLT